jgi:hypothetical protein
MQRLPFSLTTVALFLSCALTSPLAAQAPAAKTSIRAGFAERDITPALGMEQPGGYGKSFHKTLHDPCKVRAAVFDDGQKKVALVGTDTLIIPRALVLAARKEIAARCGISAVMVGASHSHSSGPTGMVQPGEFDHASDLVKKLAYEKSSCADAGFLKHVQTQIVAAVCAADSALAPAKVGFGSGTEDKVAFNRRLRMKNGLSFSHPGKGNPDVLEYAGPIDPQVGVIGAWGADGKLLGAIVNYACHATTNPGGISANWIYYLEQTIQGALGTKVPVVFLQGASGDVTQVDNLDPRVNPPAEKWAQLVGGRVGAEAVKVLLTLEAGTNVMLDARAKVWPIPRRVPAPEKLKTALELVQKSEKEIGATEWTFAKETVLLDALIAKEPTVEVEVQAIQVGPAVFVSNPAEYFVQYGLDIKKGSKFPLTFPVELANGCAGYVPTEEAFGPKGGGYETRLTSYSNLEITAGRQMANTGISLANQMSPGPLFDRPKAPVGKPWTYGNLPPELK